MVWPIFASQIVRKSYAVYDDMAMNTDIERAVERLKEDGQSPLITLSEAEETSQPTLIANYG